ncbi:Kelch repeat-containing protein [Anaerovorax odorimutans]|uniref:Kelch repeat-containing protein n=1 Tax=Anaerovorax odorimutans TaxID=109327 RepID=UPI0003F4D34B|nr:Ig-like domain-containing protein [Anaerovorax odorimutans]
MKRLLTIFLTLCMVLSISGVSAWADGEEGWQEEAPMSKGKINFSVATVGDKIYTIGGRYSPELNEIYNTTTGTWETGASVPIPKKFSTCAVVGEKIYMFGIDENYTIPVMQIYDTKTNTWTSSEDVPQIKTVEGFSAVAVNNKVYFIMYNSESKLTNVQIFDTITGVWTTGSDIGNIGYNGIVSIENNIYSIGGGSAATSKCIYKYDIEEDNWTKVSEMPNKKTELSACANGNNIYVTGGRINGSSSNLVYIYDITNDTWTKEIPMSEIRIMHGSVIVNGKLYVMGGNSISDNLNTMESLKIGDSTDTDNKLSVLLNTGETVQLSVSYNLTDNTNFTWSSTNEAVATVDANGKVTAVGEGQADIYAENADGTFKEYIPVKVVEGTADEMRLAVHLKAGDNSNLYLSDDPSLVTWTSMDESVAIVSASGKVTAVKKGLAIIQGELEGQTYQIYVRVNV